MSELTERFIRITIAALLIVTALSIIACKEGYKSVEIREGFIHFSFEYPANYQSEPLKKIGGGDDSTVVYIRRFSAENFPKDSKGSIVLQIIAQKVADPTRNAEYWYQDSLEELSSPDSVSHIIERSTVKEGIISGKSLTYSRLDYTDSETPITLVSREIYFDRNGIPFIVRSVAEQSVSRQAEADLNHVLRTFKILD